MQWTTIITDKTMTNEECLNAVKYIENEYNRKKDELNAEYKKKTQSVLNQWARNNARFGIGDIIKSNDIIIVVEKIMGVHDFYYSSNNNLCVVYWGSVLTKKLEKRKDEFKSTIYDEESREIKLVKKAEV